MSTLNLMYNVSYPNIHYIVKAGQSINISDPGIYNIVPIDLEPLIAGANDNINIATKSLFEGINNYKCSNDSNHMAGNSIPEVSNPECNTLSTTQIIDILEGGSNELHISSLDESPDTVVDDTYNIDTIPDIIKNVDPINNISVIDKCRGIKTDNVYNQPKTINNSILFTENLAATISSINRMA
jgi:hypothetical protein